MTTAKLTQMPVLVLGAPVPPSAQLTQMPVLVLGAPPVPVAQLTQMPVLVLGAPPVPVAQLTQMPVLVLGAPIPIVVNYSYTYRKLEADIGAKLGASTGITLTGVWPLGDPHQALIQVAAQLPAAEKSALDAFMASRGFFFVSESGVEVPPPWPSDPITPP